MEGLAHRNLSRVTIGIGKYLVGYVPEHFEDERLQKRLVAAEMETTQPYLIDLGEILHIRPMQNTQGQTDHLQILATSCRRDVARFGANIIYDRFLQPRDKEVGTLVDYLFLDPRQAIENNGACAAFDIVHGGISEGETNGERHGVAIDCLKTLGRHSDYWRAACRSLRSRGSRVKIKIN